jgi:hypothetical protein
MMQSHIPGESIFHLLHYESLKPRKSVLPFKKTSRPSMGFNQAATECVLLAPFPVVERLVRECGHSRQFIIILLINAQDE